MIIRYNELPWDKQELAILKIVHAHRATRKKTDDEGMANDIRLLVAGKICPLCGEQDPYCVCHKMIGAACLSIIRAE